MEVKAGLISVIVILAAGAFLLERHTKWGQRLSGVVLAMFSMMLLSNLGWVPAQAPSYDFVFDWVVPVAIPMFLFRANLVAIFTQTGRLMVAFVLGGLGTVLGAFVMFWAMGGGQGLHKAFGLFTATYVGGTVNFVAISEVMKIEPDMVAAAVAADNVAMAVLLLLLFAAPSWGWLSRRFPNATPEELAEARNAAPSGGIKADDVVLTFSVALVIACLSMVAATWIPGVPHILISTLVTVILATAWPSFLGSIQGSEELGVFLMYMFFAVVGASAQVGIILERGLPLFLFAGGTLCVHLLFLLVMGKVLGLQLPQILLASNACVGGPTTACGMAMAKRWDHLVAPSVLVGLFGYIIATFLARALVSLLPA